MNNDVLMRRIAAATEAQNRAAAAEQTEGARAQQAELQRRMAMASAPTPPVQAPQPPRQNQPVQAAAATPVVQTAPPIAPAQPVAAPNTITQPMTSSPPSQPTPVAQPVTPIAPVAAAPEEQTLQEEAAPPVPEMPAEPVGVLIACDGVNAVIETRGIDHSTNIAVGQMITLEVDGNKVVGLIHRLSETTASHEELGLRLETELQGEVRINPDGSNKFHKGIATYPIIGTVANLIRSQELAALYSSGGRLSASVGQLAQEASIPAYIDIEAMLSKHFAVVGSTGCGKSSAVSLLLRKCWENVPDLRTVVLDPHNEYASAFPEGVPIDASNLSLPFWMFQLEEFAEVMFRGKSVDDEEVSILRELIPEAKQRFRDGEERLTLRNDSQQMLTADTPIPYRISDLLAMVEEEIGQLEARFERSVLKSLKARIVAHSNDPRYKFMFRDKTISDRAEEVLDTFFNLQGNRSNMTILMMAGMPSEVVNVLASVVCRLSFELCLAGQGALKCLVVCEEAHRYIPDGKVGFEPSRRAIARIAKEGRKYGSFIAIISQRPAELDPTILSQCSTIFSLRLSNELDQILMRKAISNASSSTISFLSSLANREAIAFGEGLLTPMRLKFEELPQHHLPGKDRDVFADVTATNANIGHIFHHWRGGGTGTASARRVA